MEKRTLGRAGREVSVVGLGTWQLGADWGEVGADDAKAVLDAAVEAGVTLQTALRWIIQQPGVTSVIPGARSPEQARGNAAAARLNPLPAETLEQVRTLYDRRIRPQVHDRW